MAGFFCVAWLVSSAGNVVDVDGYARHLDGTFGVVVTIITETEAERGLMFVLANALLALLGLALGATITVGHGNSK